MNNINYTHSVSGYAYQLLTPSTSQDSKPSGLKLVASTLAHGALLVASAIETIVRHALAYGSYLTSLFLKGEKQEAFIGNYVTPFFEHAELNKKVLSAIKVELSTRYSDHVKPFLSEKVSIPT